ncbi:MAG: oxidoreductase C-terminal domain-containing protein [Caulobacteraceae bacterium]
MVGASAVNAPRELRRAQSLVRNRARPDPNRLADPAVDLARVSLAA